MPSYKEKDRIQPKTISQSNNRFVISLTKSTQSCSLYLPRKFTIEVFPEVGVITKTFGVFEQIIKRNETFGEHL